MPLINQHLGISKGWLSRLLLCLEKSRSAWKRGKARQHIEILGEVFHHSLTKIGYSSEGSRSSSWKRVGHLSLPLFRLSSVSELMLHILIYTSRSPQQSLIWAMICQTRWSGLLVFKELITLISIYRDLVEKIDLGNFFVFFCNKATKQAQHKSTVLSDGVILTCMKLFLLISSPGQINNEWGWFFYMSRKNRHGCFKFSWHLLYIVNIMHTQSCT